MRIDERSVMGDDLTSQIAITKKPLEPKDISSRILTIRGQRVILDADLAELYGVTTGALNQAVKRNKRRFPKDFSFRLTAEEKEEVVTKCDNLARLKFSPVLPLAFTEHGAIMAASILNSKRAVETSVYVVRAFVRMSEQVRSGNRSQIVTRSRRVGWGRLFHPRPTIGAAGRIVYTANTYETYN